MSNFLCPRQHITYGIQNSLCLSLVTDSQMFFFQASFGGTSPDPHSVIWHGGKGQHLADRKQVKFRLSVIHPAHVCETAVSSRVFWFRHCWTHRNQRREWPIASLSSKYMSDTLFCIQFFVFLQSQLDDVEFGDVYDHG